MSDVTLKEVAQSAGVSISVASRALNGHAEVYRISEQTAKRVQDCAQQLGFRPSQAARSFRLQKSGLIGVVVPDLANPFFASISRSVALAAEADEFSVIVADSREETEHEVRLLEHLQSRQVEGLVVCPVGIEKRHLQEIQRRGTPLVLADRTFPDCDLMQVTSEHRLGAEKATQLLTRKGHRTIGVLQGLPGTLPNEERLLGYRAVLRNAHIALDDSLVAGNNFTEASGYHSAKQLLSVRKEITALFALSTPNAMGALRAAQELGLHVPDDLSIVAFDDSPFADLMSVPLTTVCQNVHRIGELAASMVLKSISHANAASKTQHAVKVRLVQRNSISKPKLDRP